MKNVLSLLAFFMLGSSLSVAQSPQKCQRPSDGGTREVLISILIPSLSNAPFHATVNTEWIRQLGDGSTITLKNHRAIARDGTGRIFQERRALVPDDGKHDSPVTQIEISDPVSHKLYICVPQEFVCQLEVFSPPEGPDFEAAQAAKPLGSAGTEDLGKQLIGGLETVGERETLLIETGAIGNDRPLSAQREFWYSPELSVNLISRRQDPRFGTQNFELSDVILGEPDPKLFELPSGSKIIDLRKPKEISPPADAPSN
jgi:hypothetical protein